MLGDNPTTVATHGVEGGEVFRVAVLIAFVPPLVLWVVVRLTALLHARAGRVLLFAIAGVLVALFVVQLAKSLGMESRFLLVVIAVEAGAAFTFALVRWDTVWTWTTYTACLPLLAVVNFAFASPVSDLRGSRAEVARASGGDHPSMVMIILDELPTRSLMDPAGEIDRARFPNLAAFTDDATWYRHNTSVATNTSSAVPALLTGRYPTTDPPLASSHPDNLFTLLAPTHELEVFETATRLCPYESCAPTDASGEALSDEPGTRELLSTVTEAWIDRVEPGPEAPSRLDDFAEDPVNVEGLTSGTPAEWLTPTDDELREMSGRAGAFMASLDASEGPTAYFLHLMLPHQPWRHYPDGEIYLDPDPLGLTLPEADRAVAGTWSPWAARVTEQRHLLQLAYTDRIVGQIVAALEAEGLYDESLVVVASDHGVSFEPRTVSRALDRTTVDAVAYAPLLVKAPGQTTGSVDDSNLMTIDVVPTIADLLGLEMSWDADGAPAGSPAITARAGIKRIDSFGGLSRVRLVESLEFDDRRRYGGVSRRAIGALTDPDDPLSALNATLGLEDIIGVDLSELTTSTAGEVMIRELDALRHPDGPRMGLVTGRVIAPPPGSRLVLAVNGTVVGGSELSTDAEGVAGRFVVLLPQGQLGDENEIRAALVRNDTVVELAVRGISG
jgi:hypothetical protein